jgi:phosphopantothenoylcysteine decarboxylase/phosphopantothenate--cysteine ligase
MFNAVQAALPSADVFIACAAVADYRPAEYATQKIKKDPNHPNAEYVLRLVPNPDILAWAGHNRQPNQVIVGFALEIEDAQANALRKLTTKRADFIALNIATEAGSGFGTDTNRLTIYDAQGSSLALAPMPKAQAAKELLRYITPALNAVSHP